MHTLKNTKARIGIVLLLALSTLGATYGTILLAQDNLLSTQNYSILTVDLQGDGFQSVTHNISLTSGEYSKTPILISNNGSTAVRYNLTTTLGANAGGWNASNTISRVYSVADSAACTGLANATSATVPAGLLTAYTGAGSMIGEPSFGDGAVGQQTGDRILGNGSNEMLCLVARYDSAPATATATEVMTFHAETTYLNP